MGLIVGFTMSIAIFSVIFCGDIANHRFCKALISAETKNQCFYFFWTAYGGHFGFSKWAPRKSNLNYNSSTNWHRITILESTHMFSGSKNRVKPFIKILSYPFIANSKKYKTANGENHFMTKSQYLYWKLNYICWHCIKNNTNVLVMSTGMVI